MNRNLIFTIVKALVSILLIIFLFNMVRHADWQDILNKLNPLCMISILLIYLIGQALSTLRWRILCADVGLKDNYFKMYGDYLVGIFFSIFLPTSVGGDLVRAWRISLRFPKSHIKAILSVLAERFNGFAFINSISLIGILLFKVKSLEVRLFHTNLFFDWWAFWLLSFAFFSGALLICYGFPYMENAPWGRLLFHRVENTLYTAIEKLTKSGRQFKEPEPNQDITHPEKLWAHAKPTTQALVVSLFVHSINIGIQYTFLNLLGYPVNPLLLGSIYSLGSAASMFPLSLNGIGARESIFVMLLYKWANVPLETGSVFSLAWLSVILLSAIPGGLICFIESFEKKPIIEQQ